MMEMLEPVQEAIAELNALSQEDYEKLAKRIADVIAEHDTQSTEYRLYQRHHGGEGVYRLAGGSRSKAQEIVTKVIAHYNQKWADMTTDKDFNDYVLAYLCGNGMEVEWDKD